MRRLCLLLTFMLSAAAMMAAPINVSGYGIDSLLNKKKIEVHALRAVDSMVSLPTSGARVYNAISTHHSFVNSTTDFYLLLVVFMLLGLIRLSDPRYFSLLIRSFINPTASSRQLKEQIQAAQTSNFLMNAFFGLSTGAYLFYVVKSFMPGAIDVIAPVGWLLMLTVGVLLIYLLKYFAITLSGWAFRVSSLTEQYIYNVYLVNKVIGIALLPFTVMLAFGSSQWQHTVFVGSLIVMAVLFVNRYFRSWQAFGSFFQFSKFHFFIYLCASELLPIAVLTKFIVNGML